MTRLAQRPAVTLERVFTALYVLDVGPAPGGDEHNDLALFLHPNGLVVVCLAPSHWALQPGPREQVSLQFTSSVLASQVSGKRKRGGAVVQPDTVLATLSAGGRVSHLRACVRAKLLECNSQLQDAAGARLLVDAPRDAGFIAVLMPFDEACTHSLRQRAVSREAYEERWRPANPGMSLN